MAESFFLYGVYDEGESCFGRFKDLIIEKQPAFVRGTICKFSCGMPVLKDVGEAMITGSLVELNLTDSGWPILDALNGFNPMSPKRSLIHRAPIEAFIADGASLPSQTYLLNPEKSKWAQDELDTGQWKEAVDTELIERLTDRQKEYIVRLSRAKGREIVPVDMGLYRELLSLEMIVDKGRRLALTKLGQEVSLFL